MYFHVVTKHFLYSLGGVVHTANLEISSRVKSCRFQEVNNSKNCKIVIQNGVVIANEGWSFRGHSNHKIDGENFGVWIAGRLRRFCCSRTKRFEFVREKRWPIYRSHWHFFPILRPSSFFLRLASSDRPKFLAF